MTLIKKHLHLKPDGHASILGLSFAYVEHFGWGYWERSRGQSCAEGFNRPGAYVIDDWR